MRKPAISAKCSHQTTAAFIDIFFIGIVLKVLACPCMQRLTQGGMMLIEKGPL
jgi:hypothetical protein